MKANEQTIQQLDRTIRKIAEKFPSCDETNLMTDIHIRVTQDSGELMVFDDDDKEITRCVVEQWINNPEDDFYQQIAPLFRQSIERQKNLIENMSILKPFSFVLEDDDKETIEDLYLVDDETVIIDPDLMAGLDDDLNVFLENLLKD
ncbi:MAG: hypothetical protein IJ159_01310 [Prevotella sp.]|nr:hypothetical protein [Prevotella sp.]